MQDGGGRGRTKKPVSQPPARRVSVAPPLPPPPAALEVSPKSQEEVPATSKATTTMLRLGEGGRQIGAMHQPPPISRLVVVVTQETLTVDKLSPRCAYTPR